MEAEARFLPMRRWDLDPRDRRARDAARRLYARRIVPQAAEGGQVIGSFPEPER